MGAAGGIGQMIGGVTQIFTAMDEQNAEHRANNEQLRRERSQADRAIEGAIEKGAYESGRQRIMGAQLGAKQRTAYANSGVDASTGTAAAVQADTSALSELDAQRASVNAAREAWGYKEQRKQSEQEYENRRGAINRKFDAQLLGGFTKWGTGVLGMGFGGGGG